MTISHTLPGLDDFVIIVVTPAEVARMAATILVDIPPVPRADPLEDTSAVKLEMSRTSEIGAALGSVRGLVV